MLVTKTTAASLPCSAQSTPSFLVLAAGILIALPEYVHYAFRHTTGWLIRSEINKLGVAHMKCSERAPASDGHRYSRCLRRAWAGHCARNHFGSGLSQCLPVHLPKTDHGATLLRQTQLVDQRGDVEEEHGMTLIGGFLGSNM